MEKKNVFRYVYVLFMSNKLGVVIAGILMIFLSALELIQPQFVSRILDEALYLKDKKLLFILTGVYFVVVAVASLSNILLKYIHTLIKKKTAVKYKIELLKHLSKQSGEFFSQQKTGDIFKVLDNDIFIVEGFGIDFFFTIIMDCIKTVVSFCILLGLNLQLVCVILIFQVGALFVQSFFSKRIRNSAEELRDILGESANLTEEYISNIMKIIMSKGITRFFKVFLRCERKAIKKDIGYTNTLNASSAFSGLINDTITILIYLLGGLWIIKGNMTIGELIAFIQYTFFMIVPCKSIINSRNSIQRFIVSINKMYELLDSPILIKSNQGCNIKEIKKVQFNNVFFSYIDKESILTGINLKFNRGEVAAIVGNSGCGKSTLIKLLYRFWDVNNGQIEIDGINIKEYNLASLRKAIAVVSQDVFMYDDTIFNNISMNKVEYEKVIDVCKAVDLYDFIEGLELGLDTQVGENGIKLSGGQKQKIAIARALLDRDGKILILDEATSAMDNITQSKILSGLNKYIRNKIIIFIAHRLSTIKNVDIIYVLEGGKVVESGNHKELYNNKKQYYNLYRNET